MVIIDFETHRAALRLGGAFWSRTILWAWTVMKSVGVRVSGGFLLQGGA